MPIKLLEAAQRLGLDIKTLHKRMEKLGIEPQVSQEDKRVKVISEADYRKLGGKTEGDNGNMGISQEIPSHVPTIALESHESFPLSYDIHENGGVQNRILERLEAIESKLDALMGLLSTAAIAPRYIQRKAVEDAIGDTAPRPAIPRNTRLMRGNLPPGTQRLSLFAGLHGVPPRTARDQATATPEPKYTVTIIGTNGTREYYVEPSQAAGVVAFWKRTGYPYSPCHECPHTQEVQE